MFIHTLEHSLCTCSLLRIICKNLCSNKSKNTLLYFYYETFLFAYSEYIRLLSTNDTCFTVIKTIVFLSKFTTRQTYIHFLFTLVGISSTRYQLFVFFRYNELAYLIPKHVDEPHNHCMSD